MLELAIWGPIGLIVLLIGIYLLQEREATPQNEKKAKMRLVLRTALKTFFVILLLFILFVGILFFLGSLTLGQMSW